jgi:hypothetical protein
MAHDLLLINDSDVFIHDYSLLSWKNKKPASTWDEVLAVPPKLTLQQTAAAESPLFSASNGAVRPGLLWNTLPRFSWQLLGGFRQNAPEGAFSMLQQGKMLQQLPSLSG